MTLVDDTQDFLMSKPPGGRTGVAGSAGALAFIAGLISLSRAKNRLNALQDHHDSPTPIDLPNKSYIAPFAWAWASMLISVAPWYYRFIAVLIWTSFIDS